MPKIVGYSKNLLKRVTCLHCLAILEYSPNEIFWAGYTDEGTKVMGIRCPSCQEFIRTNA